MPISTGSYRPTIGLVGCGAWGRLVLRDLVALGAEVIVAATGERAQHAAAAGAVSVVSDLQQLPSVQAVVVVTPTSTHADVIEALLPRQVPIFCEKPLCHDRARAEDLAKSGRGLVFVMEKWRYHKGVQALAIIARSQELGPVIGLRTRRVGWGHRYADVDCVWTLMPHELSIATEILGAVPTPRAAVADMGAEGILGMISVSDLPHQQWYASEISVRSPAHQRSVTLICRDGSAELADSYADHLTILSAPPAHRRTQDARPIARPIATDMPLMTELDIFLRYLRGGPPPKGEVAEAAEAVARITELRRLAGI
jgi:predicted dehydrogenase